MRILHDIEPLDPKITKFMAMEPGPKRNFIYSKHKTNFKTHTVCIYTDDEKIFCSSNSVEVKQNKNAYYLAFSHRSGFTIDPTNKNKITVWYKKSLRSMPYLDKILFALGYNWLPETWTTLITPTILTKIVNGKITNPVDFVAQWLKGCRVKVSPRLAYNLMKEERYNLNVFKKNLILRTQVAVEPENVVKNWNGLNSHIDDMVEQALILDRKINFQWSPKRMTEEHEKMTADIMAFEIDSKSKAEIIYPFLPKAPSYSCLLNTETDVFAEGKRMRHCIYTNYWWQIKEGKYVVYRLILGEHRATLGLTRNATTGKLTFNQMYAYRNSTASPELTQIVDHWKKNELAEFNHKIDTEYKDISPKIMFEKLSDHAPNPVAILDDFGDDMFEPAFARLL